jgi:hypothetical protein
MAFGRKPLSPEMGRARQIEKLASKKPSLGRRIRRGVMIGALAGGIGASQGPAFKQHYNATESSMRKGAEMSQLANQSTAQRMKGYFIKQKVQEVKLPKDAVAMQSVKTYKPTISTTPSSLKTTAKGVGVGAGVGFFGGIFSFFTGRRKYNKKMNKLANQK